MVDLTSAADPADRLREMIMRIGELAGAAGVSVRALRYYEEQGLLTSERTQRGQRTYLPAAVDRVELIQQLYAAGLPSRTILEVLPCVHTGVTTPETLALLTAERDRIDRQITGLLATRDRLDSVIAIAGDATHPCTHKLGASV